MISEVSYMQSFLGSHTNHQHAYCEPVQRLLEGTFLVKLGRKPLDTLGSGLLCSLRSLLCFPCPCILSWFPLLSEVRRRICESWNGWACCYSALTLGLLPSAWKAFTISLAGSVLRSLVTFVAVPLVSYLFVFLETLIFFFYSYPWVSWETEVWLPHLPCHHTFSQKTQVCRRGLFC